MLHCRQKAKGIISSIAWRRERERERERERGAETGSARRSSLNGRERAIVSQTNIGTVSKAALGKRLGDSVERTWAFLSA